MTKEFDTCAHCGSKKKEKQPLLIGHTQTIEYECGNSVAYEFGQFGEEDSYQDNCTCSNKIVWDNILVEQDGEFDESAKTVDSRFYGWREYCFFKDMHSHGWFEKYPGQSPLQKQFLDKYFEDKEAYIKGVRNLDNALTYHDTSKAVQKSYPDWIGDVYVIKTYENFDNDVQTIIYKVVKSEDDPSLVDGYVVETNPVGGGDRGRDFYRREILNIIMLNEKL